MSTYTFGSEPLLLPEMHEARDLLTDLLIEDGLCIAIFKFGAVTLPPELELVLRDLVGKKCAILRLDGRYHCRAI